MSTPPLLEVRSATKAYGPIVALGQANLRVHAREVLGICGHNGAGKSTLVKILAGVIQPDAGQIRVSGVTAKFVGPRDAQRHGIAHVDQELTIIPVLSVRENLRLGDLRTPWWGRGSDDGATRELLDIVGLGHVEPGRLAGSLTLGERQLLEVARGFGRNCRVLVLDEPTATLSRVEIARVFSAIRRLTERGAAVIFISHRLDEVFELCDRVVVMRDGEVRGDHPIAELDRKKLVELILGEQGHLALPRRAERSLADPDGGLLVEDLVTELTPQPCSFAAKPGRIVGLAGQIGSGNTAVLHALAGLDPGARGRVSVGRSRLRLGSPRKAAKRGIAFVSGDRKASGLFLTRSIAENLLSTRLDRLGRGGLLPRSRMRSVALDLASLVHIDRTRLPMSVDHLSGGNQQKVLVGRGLNLDRTKVMLLEEPTRGVDVGGRAEIHDLIRHFADSGGTVIFSSTELAELLELADDLLVFRDGIVTHRGQVDGWTEHSLLTAMTTDVSQGARDAQQ